MYSRKLLRAQIRVERFLEKQDKQNKVLNTYKGEDEFRAFHSAIKAIIAGQIRWTSNHLDEMNVGNDELQEHQIEQLVSNYLDHKMPTFKSQIDEDVVYDNYLAAFETKIRADYKQAGAKLIRKSADYIVDFELTNKYYLQAIQDETNYLLNTKSTAYDQTTKDRLINIVKNGRMANDTIDEISSTLQAQESAISSVRADMISTTETANMFGSASDAFREQNNVPEKEWVIAGPHPNEDECDDNADASPIPSDEAFPSGDMSEPAHIGCECYTDNVGLDLTAMSDEDLDALILWDGS